MHTLRAPQRRGAVVRLATLTTVERDTAHEQLRSTLAEYPSDELFRLVLECGRDYDPREPPLGTPAGEFMCCFFHAFALAERHGLSYCEGWVNSWGSLTMLGRPHAWCVDGEDRVVDPLFVGRSYDVAAYRGIVIPLEVATPHVGRYEVGTLKAYENDVPMLRAAIADANNCA